MSEEDNASNYDTDNNIVNDSIEEELLDAATGSKEVTVAASTELLVAASTDSKEPSDPSSPGPEISRPKSKEKLLDESLEKSINTKENIRPRSQCDGGTKQLKLKNQTKGSAPNCTVKERALARINKKVGEDKSAELKARWDEIQHQKQKPKKEIQSECDGMIKTLLSLGFSKVEVTTFLCVGGPRVNRIMAAILNPPVDEPTSKPPAHAATEGDIKRVLEYITMLDLEPGYPCAHKKIPLYVVGEHQGFSWKQLHSEYEKKCLEDHARVLSCNRFREYVQHYIPAIKLGKTQTDLCNECYTISIQLKNPDISDEEKSEMKLKLSMHLDEANIQRRAMNAYITAVKSKIAPNDPPFRFEPCYIPEVEDEILGDALNLFKHSRNPALDLNDDGISDLETDQVEPEKGATNISSTNVLFLHTVWVDNANSSQVNNNSGDALRKDENKEHMEVTDKDEEENMLNERRDGEESEKKELASHGSVALGSRLPSSDLSPPILQSGPNGDADKEEGGMRGEGVGRRRSKVRTRMRDVPREASKQTQDKEVSKAVEDIKGSKPKQVKKKRGIVEYIESTGEKRFIQNYVLLTALIQVWKIQTKRLL